LVVAGIGVLGPYLLTRLDERRHRAPATRRAGPRPARRRVAERREETLARLVTVDFASGVGREGCRRVELHIVEFTHAAGKESGEHSDPPGVDRTDSGTSRGE
jgi:hypothetical protein